MMNGGNGSEDLQREHRAANPSPWVTRFLGGAKPGGTVLDVACGAGRHLRMALEKGFSVTGIDRDLSRVEDIAGRNDVGLIEADLESGHGFPLKDMAYDAVIVTNYLWRPILGEIVGCVAEDGILVYETFALGQEKRGKPSNPDFLLKPNELLEAAVPHLAVVAYEHGVSAGDMMQRIAACGPEHPWAKGGPLEL